mgnify:CR=1 FL=1
MAQDLIMNQDIIKLGDSCCTVEPDPQWVKDFTKEIREEFHLDYLTAMCIAGVMEKYLRLNKIDIHANKEH